MTEPTVHIVDDDPAVRDSLALLADSAGLSAATYASAKDFLDNHRPLRPGCLVLDMHLPDIDGLELLEQWAETQPPMPVIVLTGHGDVPAAVKAMKVGAMDFMQKPFDGNQLLQRIQEAIERDRFNRHRYRYHQDLTARLARLTPREREVMDMIVGGKANKVIALDLDISERTVELHRARIMKKMQVRSLAELIQTTVAQPASINTRSA